MSLLTFAPAVNPSFGEPEDIQWPHIRQEPIKPYDVVIPTAIRSERFIPVLWKAVAEDVLNYIESFFDEILGPSSAFLWTPPDRIRSPLHRGPDLDQLTIAGAPGSDRNYRVRYTWFDPTTSQETKPSPVSTFTAQAGKVLTVTVPTFPNTVKAFRVYAGTVVGDEWRQAAHSTIRTWQEPLAGLITITSLAPTSNTLKPARQFRMVGGLRKRKISAGRWELAAQFQEEYS